MARYVTPQWEYRYRKQGSIVHVTRIKGLLSTDNFSFECTIAEFKAWAKRYETNNGRKCPLFMPCPYVPASHKVQLIVC
jgi:hypothetical protein